MDLQGMGAWSLSDPGAVQMSPVTPLCPDHSNLHPDVLQTRVHNRESAPQPDYNGPDFVLRHLDEIALSDFTECPYCASVRQRVHLDLS